jgi:clan AA aspartic protease
VIAGVVQDDEARIRLEVRGPAGQVQIVEAVVDTGYTGELTLPPAAVVGLGLPWLRIDTATLADGSECLFDVYEAEIVWDGSVRQILIDVADAVPLVGMALLRDHEMRMTVRDGGPVTIERLP